MSSLRAVEDFHVFTMSIGHAFLWVLGLAGLGFGARRLERGLEERVQVQGALRESEEKYRSILEDVVDSSDVGLFILDSEFRVVWINRALELYLGVKRNEVVGKDKRTLVQERIKHGFDDPEAFGERVLATYDDNTYTERFECRVKPDGEREGRWVEHQSRPIRRGLFAGGRIELYYDISKIKRAEKALRDSEEKCRAIFEQAAVGVALTST